MNDSLKGTESEKAKAGLEAKPDLKPETKPAAKPEPKVELREKVEAKAESKAEPKAEQKAVPKPAPPTVFEPESEAKPEPRLESKFEAEAPMASGAAITQRKPALDPVQAGDDKRDPGRWTRWLVWFLRAMAVLSMMKGLYHWSLVLGIGEGPDTTFTTQSLPWQSATVYFAIIDLVAAVGLWLAAVWGAVVWLTAGVSMAAVEVFFPQIYGGSWLIVAIELFLLCCYLVLALQSAREHPH